MMTIVVTIAIKSPCAGCQSAEDRIKCSKSCIGLLKYRELIDIMHGLDYSLLPSSVEYRVENIGRRINPIPRHFVEREDYR